MKKRMLSLLLTLLFVVGICAALPVASGTDTDVTAGVTRSQWLQQLVATFEMTVEDGVYPDNYFSDLSSSSEYYYDMLLAVEFGVVDIPAGGELRPDDPATREFAAQTMNFCLGYQLGEDAEYSYLEADDVTYPDDIQVAINRGWFALTEDGAFLPEQPITSAEADIMIADAEEVLAATGFDENFTNVYEFAEGVVEVPGWANVTKSGENEITISDCPVELEQGQQFAVYFGNVPSVYTAEAIEETEDSLVISTVRVEDEEAFTELELQGSTYLDPASIEPAEGAELVFIDPMTGEEYTDPYAIPALMSSRAVQFPHTFKENLELPVTTGTSVQLEITVKNAVVDYKISMKDMSAAVTFDADVDVDFSFKGDLMEILQSPLTYKEIRVINATAPGVGGFVVALDLELSAEISGGFETKMQTGISYHLLGGPRVIKNFNAKHFTLKAEGTAQLGVMAKLGFTDLPVIKGYVYGKVGMKGKFSDEIRGPGVVPARCKHVAAYLYANYGVEGSVKFGKFEEKLGMDVPVFDENNSPIRVVHHYEDGKEVPGCTVGDSDTGSYYTPTESPYWESGTSSTNASSVAYNKNGQAVTLWQYTLDDAGNATITRYLGSNTHVVIPETIDGHTVTGVSGYYSSSYRYSIFGSYYYSSSRYSFNTTVRSVVIPDTVTTIGNYAFNYCSALESVDIPDSVISVGTYAFQNCTALQSASFGEDSVTIGDYAFQNCTDLQSVSLGEGTATVGAYAFDGCTSMTKIEVNGSIVPGTYAFQNCTALEEVHITNIAAWCATSFGGSFGNPLQNEAALYVNGEPVGDLVVSDSVTTIGDYTFYNCTNLISVVIPDSVTTIGACAFYGCKAMEMVDLPNEPIGLGAYVFSYSGLKSIYLPVGTTLTAVQNERRYGSLWIGYSVWSGHIYEERAVSYSPFSNCEDLREISFEEGWIYIPAGMFEDCTGLREIAIPETITSIGASAFEGCSNLHTVVLPDAVLYIDIYAFADCTALKNVTLSKGIETLGSQAFFNCVSLDNITIPKSLKRAGQNSYDDGSRDVYGYGPFEGCSALRQVCFEEGITAIPACLFISTGLQEITIPESVTSIGVFSYRDCKQLRSVKMGSNVTTIGNCAFGNCIALEKLNTVASVAAGAFQNCTALTEAEVGGYASDYAFSGCTALTNAKVDDYVGSRAFENCTALTKVEVDGWIGSYAFQNCTDLEQVILNNGVTSIRDYCFYNCISLTDVQLSSGMTYIPSYAFSQCAKLRKITIPRGVTSIGSYAFHACPLLTEIIIPREVTSIDATAFSYPARMYIYGVAGTYAQTYADTYEATFIDRQTLVQSAVLNKDTLFINRGLTEQLILTAEPAGHTDAVTWKSSNTNVVTVDQKGNITAVNLGTATIKVTVGDDISASFKVTVTQPVTSIGLNISSITLEALDTYSVVASVSPSNAFDKSVSWSSSDDKIASVDENGLITAHSKGSATITATANDGTGMYNYCTVNVTNTAYVVDNLSKFQSLHNYPNNCSDNWILTIPGQESIPVTFDRRTNIEENFDFLYIYDGRGNLIGTYTGTTLAEQTVTVPGDTVKIRLISDESGRAWGFKVIDVGVQLCEHEEIKDVYEANGDRSHTCRNQCTSCEKVFAASVEACVDEDKDYTCDICAGSLTCLHGEALITYETNEDGAHLMSVYCAICMELVYTSELECVDKNSDGVCDQCVASLQTEPTIEAFDISGVNMTLGNELELNIMLPKATVDAYGKDLTVTVIHHEYVDGDTEYTFNMADLPLYGGSKYYKASIRVAAAQMTDLVDVVVTDAEGNVYNNDFTTSCLTYVTNNLDKQTAKVQTLLVDMVNYGAAAQDQFSYRQDLYANSNLTEAQKALATGDVECTDIRVKGDKYVGSNLSLQDQILLNFFFTGVTDDVLATMTAKIEFTGALGNEVSVTVPAQKMLGRYVGVAVNQIVLADSICPVTVTMLNADGSVYGYATDSVESYNARQNADGSNALYTNIMKFATSALAYKQ